MLKSKVIIFTNNERSINIIKTLKKTFKVKLIVSIKKNLNKKLLFEIKKFKIPIRYLSKNNKKLYNDIKFINPNFIICAGFTKLIPKKILDLANISAINLHGGRVPSYLGASTLNWQIINNEKNIYISVLKMNSEIDGGPLIVEKKIKIRKDDYIDSIKKKINLLFPKLCLMALKQQINKVKMTYYPMKQKIYWRQRNKNDSKIDFINSSLLETYNQIRACSPHEYPAFMIIKNIKYLLFKAKIQNFKSRYTNKRIIVKKNSLLINFKNKHLLITNFKRLKKTF